MADSRRGDRRDCRCLNWTVQRSRCIRTKDFRCTHTNRFPVNYDLPTFLTAFNIHEITNRPLIHKRMLSCSCVENHSEFTVFALVGVGLLVCRVLPVCDFRVERRVRFWTRFFAYILDSHNRVLTKVTVDFQFFVRWCSVFNMVSPLWFYHYSSQIHLSMGESWKG